MAENKEQLSEQDEKISAFAYKLAKQIESLIKEEAGERENWCKTLEALVLSFEARLAVELDETEYFKIVKMWREHFNIKEVKQGEVSGSI